MQGNHLMQIAIRLQMQIEILGFYHRAGSFLISWNKFPNEGKAELGCVKVIKKLQIHSFHGKRNNKNSCKRKCILLLY